MRDDRVLSLTRVSAWVVAAILAVAAGILYLFPGQTPRLWAWPMGPEMTALTVGAGYLAGAMFFVRAAWRGRWHAMGLGLLCAAVLTVLLLLATLLHWESFSHGHLAFWVWLGVYVVTPAYLPWLWLRNRRRDPGMLAGGDLVPGAVRAIVGGAGGVLLAAALALFAWPETAAPWWPWALSPLTARTVAAFVAFVAATWLAFLVESRWAAHRLHVQSTTLGLALVALAAVRAREDFTGELLSVTLFAGALGGALVGLLWLQAAMRRRRTLEPPSAPARGVA